MKAFRIPSDQIAPLIPSMGWCLATDRILVDGCKVGYMYRDHPKGGGDSGWRFFAGDESDEYMANNSNHGVYEVNTIANYDTAVIPYLSLPPGTHLDRGEGNGFAIAP
jgi:hypothetical protein